MYRLVVEEYRKLSFYGLRAKIIDIDRNFQSGCQVVRFSTHRSCLMLEILQWSSNDSQQDISLRQTYYVRHCHCRTNASCFSSRVWIWPREFNKGVFTNVPMVFGSLELDIQMELDRCDNHSITELCKANLVLGFLEVPVKLAFDTVLEYAAVNQLDASFRKRLKKCRAGYWNTPGSDCRRIVSRDGNVPNVQ